MKYCLLLLGIYTGLGGSAQTASFDIISYLPPAGWNTDKKENVVIHAVTDTKNKTWCQLALYGSVVSKGNPEDDFITLWGELVEKPLNASLLQKNDTVHAGEWIIKAGIGTFRFNNSDATALLTTLTGKGVCVGIVANTNSTDYIRQIQEVLESVQLSEPAAGINNTGSVTNTSAEETAPSGNGFTFNTTTFDDGWVSTVREDWAEVSKPGIKILVHYPHQKTDQHNFNKLEGDNNAWNVLVAPRYNQVSNFLERGIQDYQSITFLTADAVDRQTGKNVHIVLFKKHYDKGNGRYLEVVADNQAVFEKEFGNNYINRSSWDYLAQSKSWDKLADMQWRNKFAVGANDLIGKWSSNTYASLAYYYVNGGGFAGATATSIADEFTFFPGNTYQSDHAGASGAVGNQKFSRQVYKGNSTVTDWTLTLGNRYQGASEKFDCYFEAVKGGRILMMTDRLGTTISLVKSK